MGDVPATTGSPEVDAELADAMTKGWVSWDGTRYQITDEGRAALARRKRAVGDDFGVDAALTRRGVARAFGVRVYDDGTVSEVIDVDETPSGFMEAMLAETTWTCRACDFGTYYDESIPPEPFPCPCCDGIGVHWPGEGCWA